MQKLTIILLVSVLVLLCIAASADAGRPGDDLKGVGKVRGGNRGRGRGNGSSSSDSSSSSSSGSNSSRGRGKGRGRGRGNRRVFKKVVITKGGRRKCGPNAHWVKTACVCNTGCHGNPYRGCKLAGKRN